MPPSYDTYLPRLGRSWRNLALVSLTLTSCSGLMAVCFWTFRGDFDPGWWLPNLFLLIYPLWFIDNIYRPVYFALEEDCLW